MARARKQKAAALPEGGTISPAADPGLDDETIESFLEHEGFRWLRLPNVVGIAVAEKERDGRPTGELAVKFDVIAKLPSPADVARAGSRPIPPFIDIGGHRLPTDVVEAWPEAHPDGSLAPDARCDPVVGGVSIGTSLENGTLGAIVWDAAGSRPVALSNWHVIGNGQSQASVFQPGPGHGGGANNELGRLTSAGVLNRKVDAATATIDGRSTDGLIFGLGVDVSSVAMPEKGARVVKSGCTTGVTHGIVTNPRKLVALAIRSLPISHNIAVCVIEPDPSHPSAGPLSAGGDSGACWMLADQSGQATGTMVGLHVGGDGPAKAYACHADQVFAALGLEPLNGRGAAPSIGLPAEGNFAGVHPFGAGRNPHRVIARDGLIVRGGPATSFPRRTSRPFGDIVDVIGTHGEWHMVDLHGDGKSDGFMLGALLQPV